jgi:hypothetical protein
MKYVDVEEFKQAEGKLAEDEAVRKFGIVTLDAFEAEEKSADQSDGFTLPFTISTAAVDRDGDTINPKGWNLKEYRKNPVVLWAHDPSQPPVARAEKTFIDREKAALRSEAFFPSVDLYPFGNMVGRMFRQKFLNAVSVGFRPTEFKMSDDEERTGFFPTDFKKQDLLEYSAVPIPSNPEALVEARGVMDLSPMVEWAEKILDGAGSLVVPRATMEDVWKHASGDRVVVVIKAGGVVEAATTEDVAVSTEDASNEELSVNNVDEATHDVGDTVDDKMAEALDTQIEASHAAFTRDEVREIVRASVRQEIAALKAAIE